MPWKWLLNDLLVGHPFSDPPFGTLDVMLKWFSNDTIYIYIYIERESIYIYIERERHRYIHIYIYINREREICVYTYITC